MTDGSPTSTYFELSAAHTAESSLDLGQFKTGTEIDQICHTHSSAELCFFNNKFCFFTLSVLGALETF